MNGPHLTGNPAELRPGVQRLRSPGCVPVAGGLPGGGSTLRGVSVIIRVAHPCDAAAVGGIAFETGFFGGSAARYFPAPELFSVLWAGPYFAGAGAGLWVAEDEQGVAGYVVGSPDPAGYRRALRQVALHRAWRVTPVVAVPAVARYLVRAARMPGPHASEVRFPAHLHLNLLPRLRGQRVGDALLDAHLSTLRSLGVPGVQLSTTSENRAALRLYRRHGFEVAARRLSGLWTPWLGHPAEHVVMVRGLP